MAGTRKPPRLREKQGCFVTDIYRPDGSRTTISFGSPGQRTEGEIIAAFGQWLDLFNQHPHRVLAFNSPYEAIQGLVNGRTILSVGSLYDKYLEWAEKYFLPLRGGLLPPELLQIRRLQKFLQSYTSWPVADFGPDELYTVQQAMVAYRYLRPKRKKKTPDEGEENGGDLVALGRSSINPGFPR